MGSCSYNRLVILTCSGVLAQGGLKVPIHEEPGPVLNGEQEGQVALRRHLGLLGAIHTLKEASQVIGQASSLAGM